ncbi:MAG TPA: tetratricopeptide repeat protein [Tepidisphaeraceae bacterium]|jgi:tetratricopeptide (TPR) repeat protein
MPRSADLPLAPTDEPSAAAYAVERVASLADDLPFVPESPYEPRGWQLGWRAALLALLAAVAFYPSLTGDWLWHDERRVTSDLAVRATRGLGQIWAHPLNADISPVVRTLWWGEFRLFGPDALGYRLVSLLLHLATCGFAWLALRRLGVPGAWLIATAFAVHPGVLPNVAWVGRQGDLLGAAAAALAFVAYLRARQIQPPPDERGWTDPAFNADYDEEYAQHWPWAVFSLAALVSVGSGSAAMAVAALGLLLIDRRRRPHTSPLIVAILLLFAAGSISGRWVWTGRDEAVPSPVAGSGWVEAAVALPWTLWNTFWPGVVPFLYDRTQWSSAAVLVPLGTITIALLLLPLRWKRLGLIAVAAGSGFAVLQGLPALRAGRLSLPAADLLPYAAGLALIAVVVAVLLRRLNRHTSEPVERGVRWVAGIVILAVLTTLTFRRSATYASNERLLQHTLAINPESRTARLGLASAYVSEGYFEEAGTQLDRVPDAARDATWLMARGRVYDAQKRYADAAACYEGAQQLNPDDREAVIQLAEAHSQAGQPERAAAAYDALLARVTDDPGLYTNAGLVQMRLGQPVKAAELYEKALALNPAFVSAHVNLSNARFELGQPEEAARHLQEVIRLDPRNFAAFMNAGVLLHRLKEPAKAERMFRAAVSVDPRSAEAFNNLGVVLAAQDKLSEAAWSFTQAVRLDPTHAAAGHLDGVRRQMKSQAK